MANFPLLTFEQANPVLSGISAGRDIQKKSADIMMQRLLAESQRMTNQMQPQTMEEALQAMKLKNALSGVELQYAPQMNEAELSHKRASTGLLGAQTTNTQANTKKTNFEINNPLLNQTGPAGQIGAYMYLQQHPELMGNNAPSAANNIPNSVMPNIGGQMSPMPQPQQNPNMSMIPGRTAQSPFGALLGGQAQPNQQPQQAPPMGNMGNMPAMGMPDQENPENLAELLKKSIFSNLRRINSAADLTEKKVENYGFQTLPVDYKRDVLAKAAGMGIDKNQAIERFNNGETLSDMAESLGFDPNNLPEAIHAATTADISRAHFRQQAVAEINTIQPILTEAIAPYSRMMHGYSPNQIAEAISGDNPDGQARFLAARGLQPEMAALRTKAMGGQVGIGAIEEIQRASMGHIEAYQSLVSPEVYSMAQKYMDDWINMGAKRANSIAFNTEKGQNKEIGQKYSQEDLEHTAKKHGISVEEVKKRLGIR